MSDNEYELTSEEQAALRPYFDQITSAQTMLNAVLRFILLSKKMQGFWQFSEDGKRLVRHQIPIQPNPGGEN